MSCGKVQGILKTRDYIFFLLISSYRNEFQLSDSRVVHLSIRPGWCTLNSLEVVNQCCPRKKPNNTTRKYLPPKKRRTATISCCWVFSCQPSKKAMEKTKQRYQLPTIWPHTEGKRYQKTGTMGAEQRACDSANVLHEFLICPTPAWRESVFTGSVIRQSQHFNLHVGGVGDGLIYFRFLSPISSERWQTAQTKYLSKLVFRISWN